MSNERDEINRLRRKYIPSWVRQAKMKHLAEQEDYINEVRDGVIRYQATKDSMLFEIDQAGLRDCQLNFGGGVNDKGKTLVRFNSHGVGDEIS